MTMRAKHFEKTNKPDLESTPKRITKQQSDAQHPGVQHAAGNLAIQHTIRGSAQAKPSMSQSRDAHKQEADRRAAHAMPPTSLLHHKGAISSSSPQHILQHLSVGQPLDASNRALMESSFGMNFGHVRIHTDSQAAESSRMMNAKAFTVGHDIVFGEHQYEPGSASGKRLLAHELAHVVQQHSGAGAAPSLAPNSAVEREADQASQALNNSLRTITVTQRSGVGIARQMAERNLSALSDAELQAEHERVRQWLLQHTMVELDYGPTEDYMREIEEEIRRRSASSMPSPPGPSSQISSSSVPPPSPLASSALQSTVPLASGVVPEGQAAGGAKLAPLSPDELLGFVSSTRGFTNSPPGPAPFDPNLLGRPMGKGYQTYAAIQIIDKDGAQVATGTGSYSGSGSEHGEQLSIKAFGENLEALPKNVDVSGGKMMVVVETEPCAGCDSELRAFAQKLGVKEYEVYVPERLSMTTGQPVTPKTAATTVFQGGRPPTTAKLVVAETFESVPTPPASPEAIPAMPPASAVEAEAAPGGLKMVEGSGWAAFGLGLGIVSSLARQRAIERQRETEGYAPVGPTAFADEGIFSRIGRFFQDPSLGTTIPAAGRFNLPVWRTHVRELTNSKKPGESLTMDWQVHGASWGLVNVFQKDVVVTYDKLPDGTWKARVPEGGHQIGNVIYLDQSNQRVPDLNIIINGTDSEVEWELAPEDFKA